jgi:hypothetical protein
MWEVAIRDRVAAVCGEADGAAGVRARLLGAAPNDMVATTTHTRRRDCHNDAVGHRALGPHQAGQAGYGKRDRPRHELRIETPLMPAVRRFETRGHPLWGDAGSLIAKHAGGLRGRFWVGGEMAYRARALVNRRW